MFTRFPIRNPQVLAKWENALNKYDHKRKNWKATEYSRICSKHFLKTDFTNDGDRRLKFNAVPSVFNKSQSMTTIHPEEDLTSLVNTLLDGYSTDSSNSQHLIAPVQNDTTLSESVESTASNIHVEANPADTTLIHPGQDLTSLVNTLLDGYSTDSSNSQHLIAPVQDDTTLSESVESTASNIHVEANPADTTHLVAPCKRAKLQCEDLATDVIMDEKNKEILKKDKKIKSLHQKLRRKNTSISNMKQLIHTLKRKSLISPTEEEQLHREFDGMKKSIFKNLLKNSNISSRSRRYENSIKEFALTLSYYSPKAYKYVRSIIPLPHPSLIQKWARNVNCEPGFIGESFKILEDQAKINEEKKDCCLVLDAMAIRKQIQWEPANNRYSGFADYGPLEAPKIVASEALVFLLVGLRSHWKQPIGYFLTDKANAAVQAALINMALVKASAAGLKVWCVTSDGTTTNITTFRKLGCRFGYSYDTIMTKFKHPETD